MNCRLVMIMADGSRAVVSEKGVPVDLHCPTVPLSFHWTNENDINNGGGITKQASNPDHRQKPDSLAMLVAGVNHCLGFSVRSSSEVAPRQIASMPERSGRSSRLGLAPSTILH